MKSDEYLEEVLKDGFERELEVDENVARTLPFFAASLAVAATLYGYIAAQMPPLAPTFLSVVLHLLLAAAGVCMATILWCLFQAVRAREYRIPPKETLQIAWVKDLKTHFRGQGLTPATVDRSVLERLRSQMTAEYAASAEHNRTANTAKLRARGSGFVLLVAMLGIAFLMIAIIFIHARLEPLHRNIPHAEAQSRSALAAETGRGASGAAEAAGSATGREVPGGAGGEHGLGSGRSQMSDDAKTPPALPAAATPQAPPAPPQHQILKKSEDGGGPLVTRR